MTQTIGSAVETQKRAQELTPFAVIEKMRDTLLPTLPRHLQDGGQGWLNKAGGALRRGKRQGNGKYELEVAAQNNPGAFVQALREAAGLGLTPGTEEYYLTPRKVSGRLEILGIVGYQGYIELMYRAGAVSSVIVECVYSNDKFTYMPGRDERPIHEIDWDSDDRGDLRLAYAYANMKNGATSKVVVMNRSDINRIKKSAQGTSSEYSPWNTAEASMWMKTVARQLRKWVPTSTEWLGLSTNVSIPDVSHLPEAPIPDHAQVQINDPDEVVDGEIEVPAELPPGQEMADVPADVEPEEKPDLKPILSATKAQSDQIASLFKAKGFKTPAARWNMVQQVLGTGVKHADMTAAQADQLIEAIGKVVIEEPPAAEEPPVDPEQEAVDALAAEAK